MYCSASTPTPLAVSGQSMELHFKQLELLAERSGDRLDRWVAEHCPNLSRARVQELIEQRLVLVNNAPAKPAYKLRAGDKVFVEAQERPPLTAAAESIPLEILYEDDDLLAVNKPPGMTVHAGAGISRGTLVNALLGRGQSLSQGGVVADDLRPGIVHRLDKETSGVIVIAKTDYAHARLAEAFGTRTVKKNYLALAEGSFRKPAGTIDFPIGRDPVRRTRMKALVAASKGKGQLRPTRARTALTEWKMLLALGPATLLAIQLHTGRTHQIRVHLSAAKHPLVGDTLYGAASHLQAGRTSMPALGRQFLHASRIGFPHPRTGSWLEVRAPLAADLRDYLDRLAALEGKRLDAIQGYL